MGCKPTTSDHETTDTLLGGRGLSSPLSLSPIIVLEVRGSYASLQVPGADPGFFLRGGALVSCSTSTPINQIVFFLAEYQLY